MRRNNGAFIGLLLNTFFENYEMDVWQGIVDYAEEYDINLVCFVGGSLQSPYYHDEQRSAVYDLVGADNVDGLVVFTGSIAAWSTREELEAFYKKYSPLPIVNIGTKAGLVNCVSSDKGAGMEELMEHLVCEHKFERIAFVMSREPGAESEPEILLAAYKKVLEKHGLSQCPELIIRVDSALDDFSALQPFFEDPSGRRLDAIVAADDYLAIKILKHLKTKGYQVPRDIALAGFGNLDEGKYLPQPLTTVRLPAYELGQKAMEMILAILAGKAAPGTITLPARLVKRRSCGCYLAKVLAVPFVGSPLLPPGTIAENGTYKASIAAAACTVMNENFIRFRNKQLLYNWAEMLTASLFDDLENLSDIQFLSTLENIITKALAEDIEVIIWHKITGEIFSMVKQTITGSEQNAFLDTLFKRSLEMIWEITVRSLSYSKIKVDEKDEMLFSLSQAFITAFNYKKLAEIIGRELPNLGITDSYISLYKIKNQELKDAVPVVVNNRIAAYGSFPPAELIPGGIRQIDKRFSFIVMALYYKDEQLGFALFDIGKINANVYETLVVQISSTLKSIQLLYEAQKQTNMLEVKVKARTRDLHDANERLKEEIQRREETAAILKKKNEEIEELNRKLEEKSKIDSLTRLYNREAFFDLFEKELKRTNRELWRMRGTSITNRETPDLPADYQGHLPSGDFTDHIGILTIMLIDIDHFKSINDSYGHVVGDNVLKALGNLFRRRDILRREDFVGRFGGEEFIVVCPNTNSANTCEVGKRLSDEFSRIAFKGKGNSVFHVTLSIGIAEFNIKDNDALTIINRADKAMYYAKQHGRNQIAVYEKIYDN